MVGSDPGLFKEGIIAGISALIGAIGVAFRQERRISKAETLIDGVAQAAHEGVKKSAENGEAIARLGGQFEGVIASLDRIESKL